MAPISSSKLGILGLALLLAGCGSDETEGTANGDPPEATGGAGQSTGEFDGHPLCPRSESSEEGYVCSETGFEVPEYAHLPVQQERTNYQDSASGGTIALIETSYGEALMTGELFTTEKHPECPDHPFALMHSVGSIVLDVYFDFNLNGVYEVRWIVADGQTLYDYPVPDC
jgi:hypothetical protein